MAISAGPYFKFNPSVSFMVVCSSPEEVDGYWGKLSQGGSVLMELGEYPFSKRYGWLQDRYGLSWQLFHGPAVSKQKIVPSLLFVGDAYGKAEEAVNFYASVFRDSKVGGIDRYGEGESPDVAGTVKYAAFEIENQSFAAMESAYPHDFSFNEAVSFMVNCDTQEEVDYYWEKLSAFPEAEQCGWLKDPYGVSWQVVPKRMDEMLGSGDPEAIGRVTEAFLKMKKFDLRKLEDAYAGRNAG